MAAARGGSHAAQRKRKGKRAVSARPKKIEAGNVRFRYSRRAGRTAARPPRRASDAMRNPGGTMDAPALA